MKSRKPTLEKKFVSIDESASTTTQHNSPCGDCPWRRSSLKGWLGGVTVEDFVDTARSDEPYKCHSTTNQQCAGMAIFRRNICKLPRPPALVLKKDTVEVFSDADEFVNHHARGKK